MIYVSSIQEDAGAYREVIQDYPDSKVHGAKMYLGPKGPRWAPCWPHERRYQGSPSIIQDLRRYRSTEGP